MRRKRFKKNPQRMKMQADENGAASNQRTQ